MKIFLFESEFIRALSKEITNIKEVRVREVKVRINISHCSTILVNNEALMISYKSKGV